jgi:hypothetical protein
MRKALFGLFLCAAGSAFAADWPEWAMNPKAEGGVAAAECTDASGNLSVDRQMVVANARIALAQEISTRVKAVDKVYSARIQKAGERPVSSTAFQRASEQITEQALENSRVARFEVVHKMFGPDLVCALVVLGGKETRTYFNDLVRVAQVEAPPQVQEELFDTFRARKLEQ